ncbi:right-handed parallel beta-helix repeat-containing protein, partial [uncultured Methanobrevibacter sp.]|uniref:right-handed parallel beta-helix repeat-containing protein n=1 Tax=uncultured Methanobrevibacter sp. TaxID=253161 RepID=UPI0025DE38DA
HAEDYGGAIYADTVTWVDGLSYFIGNYAEDNQGGAIYTNKFTTDVKYGIFKGNQAKNDDGGAIYINKENHITFSHCTFKDNYAADEGGAIYLDSLSSDLTLKDHDSFINNSAGDEGQVVFNKGTYGEIRNNWWGTSLPNFSEDLLVEWKALWFNERHTDSKPLNNFFDRGDN